MDETVEVLFPRFYQILEANTKVLYTGGGASDNIDGESLSSLDSSNGCLSTKEVFERKSEILPNSVIGQHLR
jgi:hypothetical protein